MHVQAGLVQALQSLVLMVTFAQLMAVILLRAARSRITPILVTMAALARPMTFAVAALAVEHQ